MTPPANTEVDLESALADAVVVRPGPSGHLITLHLKVQPNAWPWLDQAAREVNQVWNWANATSNYAIRGPRSEPEWFSSDDLDGMVTGASVYFDRIGLDIIQKVNREYTTRRDQFRKAQLRFRASGGRKKALGWIPFKGVNLRVRGTQLRLMGKSIRLFQMDRYLEHRVLGKLRDGNFAQNAVGEWFLNVTVDAPHPPGTAFDPQTGKAFLPVAPQELVGIDPGLKAVITTSDGEAFDPNRSYRDLEPKIAQAQRRGHKRQAKRLHLKAKNQRKDHTNQISRRLVDTYQTIKIGNVDLSFLRSGTKAKSALDGGLGLLKAQLHAKGHRAGRSVHDVSEYLTTQVCSCCKAVSGPKGQDMLVVRTWTCPACHAVHDRDVNAAKNIAQGTVVAVASKGKAPKKTPRPRSRPGVGVRSRE